MASKVQWIAQQTVQLTGLDRLGEYPTLLFGVDRLFSNEDRHMNKIAVLCSGASFTCGFIFDFGAGLLSDVRDCPMEIVPHALLRQLRVLLLNATLPPASTCCPACLWFAAAKQMLFITQSDQWPEGAENQGLSPQFSSSASRNAHSLYPVAGPGQPGRHEAA